MPPLNKELETHNPMPIRVLGYGKPKTKKTWWALKAAESHFNVIVLDSDDGMHIANQISSNYHSRITHLNMVKTATNETVPAEFMTRLLRGQPFVWNEIDKQVIGAKSLVNAEHSYYYVDIAKLTMFDIIVADSWTKITEALHARWYKENKIDFTADSRANEANQRTHRGLFGWTRGLATWMTGQLKTLNSHAIVIAHQTVYEKRKLVQDGRGQREVVEWTKIIPISTSGPHAMQMGVDFEILYFHNVLQHFKIAADADGDREGGSRIVPPKDVAWSELQFVDICKMANCPIPNDKTPEQTAFRWFAPGEDIPEDLFGNTSTFGVLPASNASKKPNVEFKSLFSKPQPQPQQGEKENTDGK